MEKIVDMVKVTDTIRHLRERGDRVSARNIRKITGGSMKTVNDLLGEALAAEREIAKGASDLSESLTRAVLLEIRYHVQGATEELELRLAAMAVEEQEILRDLEDSEARVTTLEKGLAAIQLQLGAERHSSEKAATIAAEQIASLHEQLNKLAAENDHLIRAGEASRTEAAKALLKVERADDATKKADAQVQKLEVQIGDLICSKTEAEKRAAVAECHAKDLSDRLAEITAQITAQAERLQKEAIVAEQLRQELIQTRMAAAEADKQAALAHQKLTLLEGRVKKRRDNQQIQGVV